MKKNVDISATDKNGIFITLIVATFITAMSTTVTGNMIPNFTKYFDVLYTGTIILILISPIENFLHIKNTNL
mgnify:CR=1 FL=1